MIQLTDAHAHIKNEKQAMERITLGIPTMACARYTGENERTGKIWKAAGSRKGPDPCLRPSSMVQ